MPSDTSPARTPAAGPSAALQPPSEEVVATTRVAVDGLLPEVLSRVHPDLVQHELTGRGEPGGGSSGRGQLDPGGAAAEMPVQCRRDSHQLGMGEGVEQHPLPATLTCHRTTLPQHQ